MRKTLLALGWITFAGAASLFQMGCPAAAPSSPSSSGNSSAPVTHFALGVPVSVTAGTAFNFTVVLLDTNGNIITNYTGTVHFTSSDGTATLPADTTLTNGIGTFSATLKTGPSQTISVKDTVFTSITGTSDSVPIKAAAATHFLVTAPTSATAGTAFSFTVTARDQYNNTATGYTGTVQFTTSDTLAVLPANTTLTNGTGTFSATLKTASSQTLTATDSVTSGITGTASIAVSAAAATHLLVTAPSTATHGSAFTITVYAEDPFNNIATGYTGTVHFTSTDGAASLPANATLVNGISSFNATLNTTGGKTISATDTVTPAITGTSGTITVS